MLAAPLSAESFKQIKTKDAFVSAIAGKKLIDVNGAGHVTITKKGKLRGKFRKLRLTGDWTWKGREFCRNVVWGKEDRGTACQSVFVADRKVKFVITKTGRTTEYTFK